MASIERDDYSSYVNKRKREYLDAVAMNLAIAKHPHKESMRIVRPVELKGVDKFVDEVIPTLSVGGSGTILINGIREGTGSFERIGRNIWMESVRIRGCVRFFNIADYQSYPCIRCIIVYDRTPSGVQPGFSTIFQITDSGGSDSTPSIFTPIALEYTKRFRVLADWVVENPPGFPTTSASVPRSITDVSFDKYIPLKNLESQYSGVGNDITDISTGGLYFIYRTNFYTPAVPPVLDDPVYQEIHQSVIRLRYRD